MKKAALYAVAERMYIGEEITFDAIAAELQLSDKTVREWAKEGDWQNKRAALVKQRSALDQDLVVFARKLITLIQIDMDRLTGSDGKDPERDHRIESRVNSLSRLLGRLPVARKYEQQVAQERKSEEQTQKGTSSDEVEKRVNELLGM